MANNIAYGSSQPLINVFPDPIRARRAPTVNDKDQIGRLWIDEVSNQTYTLTSITNNQANWTTNTTSGTGTFAAVEATAGNVTVDVGNVVVTLGNVTAGGSMSSTGSYTSVSGDIAALAGDVRAENNLVATTGNITASAGNIAATLGNVTAGASIAAGTGISAGTTITAGTDITATAGDITATAGNVVAGLSMIAGAGLTVTAGGVTVTAGDVTVTAGDFVALAGNVVVGGDITASTGTLTANTIDCTTIVTAFGGFTTKDFFNVTADLGGAYLWRGFNFAHIGWNVFNDNCYFGTLAGNQNDTTASFNTGVGFETMVALDNGATYNSSVGYTTLNTLTTGTSNSAFGAQSLFSVLNGIRNSGLGRLSLGNLISGSYNLGLGYSAGLNYEAAESSNICIGNPGVLGENNTIRIGTDGAAPNQQNKCYIAGDVYAARSLNSTTGTFANSVTVGSANIVSGAGDPNGTVTATKGSLYLNLTGSGPADRAWINTNGATAWTNIATAA